MHPDGFVVTNPSRRSTDAWDFFLNIVNLADAGFLVAGDLLVLSFACALMSCAQFLPCSLVFFATSAYSCEC